MKKIFLLWRVYGAYEDHTETIIAVYAHVGDAYRHCKAVTEEFQRLLNKHDLMKNAYTEDDYFPSTDWWAKHRNKYDPTFTDGYESPEYSVSSEKVSHIFRLKGKPK